MDDRTRHYAWDDPLALAQTGRGRSGLDFLRAIMAGEVPPPPIMRTLDYRPSLLEEGRVCFTLVPREFHYNPIGVVHGGVVATILDTVMACAVHTLLPPGGGYTTLELKVNFTRALTVETGEVTAEGTVIHLGSRVATAQGRVTDAAGRLHAHATTTCLILPAPHASP